MTRTGRLRDVTGKLLRNLREQGFFPAARWAARETALRIAAWHRCDILSRELDRPFPRVRSKLQLHFAGLDAPGHAELEHLVLPWPHKRRLFLERLRRGQVAIACFREEEAIGYIWVTTVPELDERLGLRVSPGPDETYGFDLYVIPGYRPHLVGHELITRWLEHTLAVGRRRAIGVVEDVNRPMQVTTRVTFGFKTIEKVRSVELLSRRGVVVSRETVPRG